MRWSMNHADFCVTPSERASSCEELLFLLLLLFGPAPATTSPAPATVAGAASRGRGAGRRRLGPCNLRHCMLPT